MGGQTLGHRPGRAENALHQHVPLRERAFSVFSKYAKDTNSFRYHLRTVKGTDPLLKVGEIDILERKLLYQDVFSCKSLLLHSLEAKICMESADQM